MLQHINYPCHQDGNCTILALINAMVGLHHGTISVNSCVDQCKEFIVTLPLEDLDPGYAHHIAPVRTSDDETFLDKTLSTIEANYANPDFTIELLAKEVNLSVSQLNRKLNALINQPAGHLISSLRLHMAATLLHQKAGTVAEIGYKLGYNDHAYFSRAFKKQFGCSPSEYMNH